jgi:signal transduction histidine kinase
MLASLRARLIVSFAVVVALAVFLAGAGALFLLRDRQFESARERYGRHAEPVNDRVASILAQGRPFDDVRAMLDVRAEELGVRLIVLDDDDLVVYDSEETLQGDYILEFKNPNLGLIEDDGARYKWANFARGDTHLTLFAPPPSDVSGGFAPAQYQTIVAVPESRLSQAWLELAPRLALAGAIALTVSFGVAFLISRSISGPLARITQASQQMARGDYDVHIPISGQDEVGRLSEAFNHMAREVNSSQRMMKDLLANVSHELKTPLTSIQGFSQAMLDGSVKDDEEFRESSRIINEEANRMRALVDDLLLLSQIESGQVLMQHAHVDLAELLERTLERFQWTLRDAEITYGFSSDRLPPVHGDERRLEQVFSNLMENAVRHTPRGGTVTVRAMVARPPVGGGGGSPPGEIQIGVHNTGSFIPPEDLPRVFERFFQVDRARARKGGSSGLGLAIVSEIVEAHGGKVRAASDRNRGTEFIVTLPPATAEQMRADQAAVQNGDTPARAPKKREAPA